MELLSSHDWRKIAELWGELNEFEARAVDTTWAHLHRRIREIVHVDHGFVTVQRQDGSPNEPVLGYRPIAHQCFGPNASTFDRLTREASFPESEYIHDPVLRRVVEGHGRPRTLIQARSVCATDWDRSVMRSIYRALEVEDRIVSMVPVADGLELTLGFDRAYGSGQFGERQAQMCAVITQGILPLARAYARSRGLMPGQQELSPREREVLTYLLGPLSEKEIADRLDLSDGYLHQVVVRIYRKLGARSRAELMSQWL